MPRTAPYIPNLCARGNPQQRDFRGICQCEDCKKFRRNKKRLYIAKPENKELHKEYVKNNPEKIKRISKKWRENNKESLHKKLVKWKEKNEDRVREYYRNYRSKYYPSNKGLFVAASNRRRISKMNRTPTWADINSIRQVYEMAANLKLETGLNYEVDHIIPLQGKDISGLHVFDNLQILEKKINRKKSNKFEPEIISY